MDPKSSSFLTRWQTISHTIHDAVFKCDDETVWSNLALLLYYFHIDLTNCTKEVNGDTINSIKQQIKLVASFLLQQMSPRWSEFEIKTQRGMITFKRLMEMIVNSESIEAEDKPKVYSCRCGHNCKTEGNLTCLGQRCTCYKEGKGCLRCRCVGCKNPNGTSSQQVSS